MLLRRSYAAIATSRCWSLSRCGRSRASLPGRAPPTLSSAHSSALTVFPEVPCCQVTLCPSATYDRAFPCSDPQQGPGSGAPEHQDRRPVDQQKNLPRFTGGTVNASADQLGVFSGRSRTGANRVFKGSGRNVDLLQTRWKIWNKSDVSYTTRERTHTQEGPTGPQSYTVYISMKSGWMDLPEFYKIISKKKVALADPLTSTPCQLNLCETGRITAAWWCYKEEGDFLNCPTAVLVNGSGANNILERLQKRSTAALQNCPPEQWALMCRGKGRLSVSLCNHCSPGGSALRTLSALNAISELRLHNITHSNAAAHGPGGR
ncbi:unnamed protein product [Pleuronectes platessa]|uniref:Uncharacterized protein n=1 Tax=Pleuronectes platessa TaxID=8262 RepID=A0A9N7TIK4_PLEPL|nr:unnamed protein product [Pleuronectes platessa]